MVKIFNILDLKLIYYESNLDNKRSNTEKCIFISNYPIKVETFKTNFHFTDNSLISFNLQNDFLSIDVNYVNLNNSISIPNNAYKETDIQNSLNDEKIGDIYIKSPDKVNKIIDIPKHFGVSENLIENEHTLDDPEQSMIELGNYLSLVGVSNKDKAENLNISFRPKNLPKKTLEEEMYHRRLVEKNRQAYAQKIKMINQQNEKRKMLLDKKKQIQSEQLRFWENEILPNWNLFKKDKIRTLKKYIYLGIPTSIRGKVWLLSIGNLFSITKEYYEIEVRKAM